MHWKKVMFNYISRVISPLASKQLWGEWEKLSIACDNKVLSQAEVRGGGLTGLQAVPKLPDANNL